MKTEKELLIDMIHVQREMLLLEKEKNEIQNKLTVLNGKFERIDQSLENELWIEPGETFEEAEKRIFNYDSKE